MNINNLYYTIFGGRLTGNVSGNGQITLKELREKIPMKSKEDYFSKFDTMKTETEQELPLIDFNLTPENFERALKCYIKEAFSESGIEAQFETLEVSIDKDGQLKISGLKNDNDNMKLAATLNRLIAQRSLLTPTPGLTGTSGGEKSSVVVSSRTTFYMQRMFYRNSDWAKSAESEDEKNKRALLINDKNTASGMVKGWTGVDLDFSKLYRKEDGSIGGYPEELAWYFEADIEYPPTMQITRQEGHALNIRRYANDFLEVGYDNIPSLGDLDFSVRFDKSDFI